MNFDRTGSASAEIVVTFPCTESVMLGWVNVKGSVDTHATCITGDAELVGSSMETSKGRDGVEKSRLYGTGLIADAVPLRERVSDSEVTLKEVRVTSLETEGKGISRPGRGSPGTKGTGIFLRIWQESDTNTYTSCS